MGTRHTLRMAYTTFATGTRNRCLGTKSGAVASIVHMHYITNGTHTFARMNSLVSLRGFGTMYVRMLVEGTGTSITADCREAGGV